MSRGIELHMKKFAVNKKLVKTIEKVLVSPELAKVFFDIENLEDMFEFLQKFEKSFSIEELEYIFAKIFEAINLDKINDKELIKTTGGGRIMDNSKRITSTVVASLIALTSANAAISHIKSSSDDNGMKVSFHAPPKISKKEALILASIGSLAIAIVTSPDWTPPIYNKFLLMANNHTINKALTYHYPIVISDDDMLLYDDRSVLCIKDPVGRYIISQYESQKKSYVLIERHFYSGNKIPYYLLYFVNNREQALDELFAQFNYQELMDLLHTDQIKINTPGVYLGNTGLFSRINKHLNLTRQQRKEADRIFEQKIDEESEEFFGKFNRKFNSTIPDAQSRNVPLSELEKALYRNEPEKTIKDLVRKINFFENCITKKDIRKRYLELARKYHPDKFKSPYATLICQNLVNAYEIL
jgi:hypothetical protein